MGFGYAGSYSSLSLSAVHTHASSTQHLEIRVTLGLQPIEIELAQEITQNAFSFLFSARSKNAIDHKEAPCLIQKSKDPGRCG